MKQLILTLSALFLIVTAYSQNSFTQNYPGNLPSFKDFVQNYPGYHKSNQIPNALKSASAYTEKLVDIVTSSANEGGMVKMDFKYDVNDHVVGSTNYMYDAASETWTGLTRNTFTYNADGNITQELTVYINPMMAGLGSDIKYVYEYNDKGQLIQMSISNKTAGTDTWVVSSRMEYTYNAQGLETEAINYTADFITGVLALSGKFETKYTTEGVLKEELFYFNNPISGSFELDSKSEYTLNAEGYIIVQTDYAKNNEGVMDFSSKTENTFDTYGCIKEVNSFEYDLAAKTWKPSAKNIPEYDYTVAVDKLLIPDHFRGMFKYKLTSMEGFAWDTATGSWKNVLNSTYNYSNINTTNIAESFNPDKVELYPNPAKDKVFITNLENDARISVFNMKGKTVINRVVENNESFSVKHLTPGMFFYKLNSDGKIYTGKLMVR